VPQRERFLPEVVSLAGVTYDAGRLRSLTFRRGDGQEQTPDIVEVRARGIDGELKVLFKLFSEPGNADVRIPRGSWPAGLHVPGAAEDLAGDRVRERVPHAGPRLDRLQDVAALIVQGHQIIHPRRYHAYYRAKADFIQRTTSRPCLNSRRCRYHDWCDPPGLARESRPGRPGDRHAVQSLSRRRDHLSNSEREKGFGPSLPALARWTWPLSQSQLAGIQ